MKNKLVIDCISLLSPLTGIGRYTYNVSKNIQSHAKYNMAFFYGYTSKELLQTGKKSKEQYLKSLISKNDYIKRLFRKIIHIAGKFSVEKYDLYWEPNFIPFENIKAKKVVTSVHDFSFILYKEFHPKQRIEYFENNFFQNIYRSDYIITGSEFSKQEILQRLNFAEDKVAVIYHGVNHDVFRVYNNISLSFDLPEKFIFCVGSIEPRKNLLGLLQAYNRLEPSIKETYKLILAGFKGWENQEVMQLIKKNEKNIHYLGYISDEELAKVYNLASLFVFPSFYEGFGLPVLEAMACATPVVCSNSSSLPEVGGDAVRYFDPNNIEDITKVISCVLKDEELQKEMLQKGLQIAKKFTWEKSAQEHSEIFQKVLASK